MHSETQLSLSRDELAVLCDGVHGTPLVRPGAAPDPAACAAAIASLRRRGILNPEGAEVAIAATWQPLLDAALGATRVVTVCTGGASGRTVTFAVAGGRGARITSSRTSHELAAWDPIRLPDDVLGALGLPDAIGPPDSAPDGASIALRGTEPVWDIDIDTSGSDGERTSRSLVLVHHEHTLWVDESTPDDHRRPRASSAREARELIRAAATASGAGDPETPVVWTLPRSAMSPDESAAERRAEVRAALRGSGREFGLGCGVLLWRAGLALGAFALVVLVLFWGLDQSGPIKDVGAAVLIAGAIVGTAASLYDALRGLGRAQRAVKGGMRAMSRPEDHDAT